jgi:hypothetical protein
MTRISVTPINVPNEGDGDGNGTIVGAPSGSGSVITSTRVKRTKMSTFVVWNDFENIFMDENSDKVRYDKCYICKRVLITRSTDGTMHLNRHQN